MDVRTKDNQAEITLIPSDWKITPLEHHVTFIKNGNSSRAELTTSDPVRYLHYGDVHSSSGNFLVPEDAEMPRLPTTAAAKLPRLKPGDVVFVDASEDVDGIGKSVELAGGDSVEVVAGLHTLVARFDEEILAHGFKGYLQFIPGFSAHLKRLAAGTKVYATNRRHISSAEVLLPPVTEQLAIAKALSDVDKAIAALLKLIAKKRDLHTGAMQRLLTGETRLPGFTDAWHVKRLGDHVSFLRNGVHSRAQLTVNDPVCNLHYGDIHVASSIRLDLSRATMPRLPTAAAARLTRLEDGDVVFVDASEDLVGVGKSLEIEGAKGIEAVAGQHTIAARFDKEVLADGFKGYLQFVPTFIAHLRRLAAGTKVYSTNRKHIESGEIALPEPEEQRAIARVLSDMEREIAALEARLAKTRDLKQAMMQALLTGRVRLPVSAVETSEPEAAHA
jgi:type I restriction enzyme S subunit